MNPFVAMGSWFLKSKENRLLYLFRLPLYLAVCIAFLLAASSIAVIPAGVHDLELLSNSLDRNEVNFQEFNDWADYFALPHPLFRFSVYAFNNTFLVTSENVRYTTYLNADVGGTYAHQIPTWSFRLTRTNTRMDEKVAIIVSVDVNATAKSLELTADSEFNEFYFFRLPSLVSFLLLWLGLVIAMYALAATAVAWWNFVEAGPEFRRIKSPPKRRKATKKKSK